MELLMDRKGSRILRIVTRVGKRVQLKNVQNASQQTIVTRHVKSITGLFTKSIVRNLNWKWKKREEANKKLENENEDDTKEK